MAKAKVKQSIVVPRTVQIEGQVLEVDSSGNVDVLGLFQPQECDIAEEFQNNEALREYQRDTNDQGMGDSF
jgi:hypothetical protein